MSIPLFLGAICVIASVTILLGLGRMPSLIVIWTAFAALAYISFVYRVRARRLDRRGEFEGLLDTDGGLQGYYAHMPDIVLFVDSSGAILDCAGDIEKLGYHSSHPENIEDLFHLVDRNIAAESIRFCLERGDRVGSAEVHLLDNEGNPSPFLMICANAIFEDRPAVRMIFQSIDRSLIRIEERLDSFFKELAKALPSPAAVLSGDKIEFANEAMTRLIGRMGGKIASFPDMIVPSDRAEAVKLLESIVSEDPAKVQGVSAELLTVFSERPAKIAIVPSVLETGKCLAIIELAESERPRTSNRCIELLFENTNDAILLTNTEGRIIKANPAAARMAGISLDELIGFSFHSLFDPARREVSLRQLAWLKDGDSVHFQSKIIADDGSSIDVDITSRFANIDGEVILHVVRDITERNRLIDRLARVAKDESLEVFAGGVALDFGSILEGISGAAALAKESIGDNAEVEAYIDVIISAAHKAVELTRGLSDYARRSKLEFEVVDLNEIAARSVGKAAPELDESFTLRSDFDESIGAIYADPAQLEQAITKLILNSREAMPDGGEILVSTRNFSVDERFIRDNPGAAPGPNVELSVKDSGRGIDPVILPRIFDPFYTTKERGEGTGLGLAITHSIVTSHGGNITIQSEADKGTTIKMLFPIIERETEMGGGSADFGLISKSNKRVMIVDDEKIIQNVLSSILQQLGYEPITVSSGAEAIEYLVSEESVIDAILLDMVMPGLSGLQTLEKIRDYWPEIPVVVVTGYSDELETIEAFETGLAGFIEKPFKASQIARKLSEIFG